MTPSVPRLLTLPILALVSLTMGADPVLAAPAPAARPSGSAMPAAEAVDIAAIALTSMLTQQSIYLPCYAFVPLIGGPLDKWRPDRSACYTMAQNKTVNLAAPLNIPLTKGKARVKGMKCYAFSGNAGDEIHYIADIMSGNTSHARINAKQKKLDAAEDVATVDMAFRDLDPAKKHYDVAVQWRVNVPDGDGWLPAANEFRGCRVDYVVENF